MDRVFGTEPRQHVEVVVPEEEGRLPRVDLGEVDVLPLVPRHGASVLCSAVRTSSLQYTSIAGA